MKIPESLQDLIDLGTLTGSSVWGVEKDSSDIDVLIHPKYKDKVKYEVLTFTITPCLSNWYDKEDFNAFTSNTSKHNIIACYDEVIYDSRIYATEVFNILCKDSDFKALILNKQERVKLFTDLCDDYIQRCEELV